MNAAQQALALVRNRDFLRTGTAVASQTRISFYGDASVTGSVDWEGIRLDAVRRLQDGVFVRLEMRFKEAEGLDGSLPGEVVALATLFLGCRLELPDRWRAVNWPNPFFRKGRAGSQVLPHLSGRRHDLKELEGWFDTVASLPGEAQNDLLWAAEWYRRALWEAETHYELAYLDLITAVEIASRRLRCPGVTWSRDYPRIDELLGRTPRGGLRKELELARTKLTEHSRLKKKFVEFLSRAADDDFWAGRDDKELGSETRRRLTKRIQSVYDVRSGRLHAGYTIGGYVATAHTIRDARMREALWRNPRRIPTLDFFAQLVRHALAKYCVNADGVITRYR